MLLVVVVVTTTAVTIGKAQEKGNFYKSDGLGRSAVFTARGLPSLKADGMNKKVECGAEGSGKDKK